MTQEQINYLAQLHSGQWFGFDGGQTYENLWVADGYEKPTLSDINEGIVEMGVSRWRSTASLTRRKFMLGIKFYPHAEGTLEDAINALRESLPEPQKTIIETSLDESTTFERNDPELIQMATAIGMTPEQIDEFYVWAENEEWRNG